MQLHLAMIVGIFIFIVLILNHSTACGNKNVSRGDKNLLSLGVAIDLTEFNVCMLA